MAKRRFSAATLLIAGAAAGFLTALLLDDTTTPAPAPEQPDEARDSRPPVRRDGWPWTETPRTNAAGPPAEIEPTDPPDSLAEILRIESDFGQTVALYNLISDAGIGDLERLIAEADTVPGASDRRAALSILYGRYADLDPAAALESLQARGGSFSNMNLHAVFHAWSRKDLAAAVEAASALTPDRRTMAGIAILTSRDDLPGDAQRDIAQRLDIENMLPQIAMQQSMDQFERDPMTAWQAALADSGQARRGRLHMIAQQWAQEDPLAAMDAVTSLSNAALRHQLQTQILYQWAQNNPQEAVDWAMTQPPSPRRGALTAAALSALATTEPGRALEYAENLQGQERDEALGQVFSHWASRDPVAAAASLNLITSAETRQGAIINIASSLVRRDPEGAVQWLATLDPEELPHAASTTLMVLAHEDPAQAGSLISRLPDDQSRQLAASSVAQAWAQQDPEAAARWVDSLVDDQLRSEASVNLVRQWASFDRDAALRYAERIPVASERDPVLVAVIQSQLHDLNVAERVFDRLTEPEQRALAARQLYFHLRESNPQRAERYRALAGFPADSPITR